MGCSRLLAPAGSCSASLGFAPPWIWRVKPAGPAGCAPCHGPWLGNLPQRHRQAYTATAARLNWMLGRCRLLPSPFSHINRAGVPSVALITSLLIGLLLLLGGASWQTTVGFVSAAMVISLAMGPVSLKALRCQAPHWDRPHRLPWATVLCPLTFVQASWAILWCGWTSPAVSHHSTRWRRRSRRSALVVSLSGGPEPDLLVGHLLRPGSALPNAAACGGSVLCHGGVSTSR